MGRKWLRMFGCLAASLALLGAFAECSKTPCPMRIKSGFTRSPSSASTIGFTFGSVTMHCSSMFAVMKSNVRNMDSALWTCLAGFGYDDLCMANRRE